MHPPFDLLFRECTKDYQIADTNIFIEKGTQLFFTITAPHYNSKYYDQPNQFWPERFDDDQISNKNSSNMPYLTFGDGPRNCIGNYDISVIISRLEEICSKLDRSSILFLYSFLCRHALGKITSKNRYLPDAS